MAKKSKVDLDKLPSSMKNKTTVKENRKPKTKEEREGEIKFLTNLLGEEAKEQLRVFNKILAKSKEKDRKKFEKKVQEKMGSFNKGGYVNCGASMKPNRMAKK